MRESSCFRGRGGSSRLPFPPPHQLIQYPSHGPDGTLRSAGRILPGTHVTAQGEPRGPYPTHMNKALTLSSPPTPTPSSSDSYYSMKLTVY